MKFDIKKFANLARVKLTPKESKDLGEEIKDILNYFEELGELDTEKVEPMTGGTSLKNVFREDGEAEPLSNKLSKEQFPEEKDGYVKAPKVFE